MNPPGPTQLTTLAIALALAFALAACGSDSTTTSTVTATVDDTTSTAGSTSASSDSTTSGGDGETPAADVEVTKLTGFTSPTGNIGCYIDRSSVRCDIGDRDWEPPAAPQSCKLDYGQGIELRAGGAADFVCAGDTALGAGDLLEYGQIDRGRAAALRERGVGDELPRRRDRSRLHDLEAGLRDLLGLGLPAVAADVAALGADDDVGRVGVTDVLHLAMDRRRDAGEAAGAEHVGAAVPEADLDRAVEDDVQLLLGVVVVVAGVVAGRDHDRVDAELLDPELAADLPEAGTLTEVVESGDGPALAALDPEPGATISSPPVATGVPSAPAAGPR